MNRLRFSIDIQADPAKIWEALWGADNYRQWAGTFYAGSYIEADSWNEGETIYFLGSDISGIYSIIEKHIPSSHIQFKHIGNVVDGTEQAVNTETEKWSGATESYQIVLSNSINTLKVSLDVMDEHLDYMTKTFPKALEVIKKNSIS